MRLVNVYSLEGRLPIPYGMHLETFSLQSVREHLLDRRLVVHQKYSARGPLYALYHVLSTPLGHPESSKHLDAYFIMPQWRASAPAPPVPAARSVTLPAASTRSATLPKN